MAAEISARQYNSVTFAVMKEVEFRAAKQNYEGVIQGFETALEGLGAFHNRVDARGSEFQNSSVTIPSEIALREEGIKFVKEYESFYAIALRAQVFAQQLAQEVGHLQPKHRVYLNEELVKRYNLEFYEELQATDLACQGYFKELMHLWGKVNTIQEKMRAQLDSQTGWAVQRFCHIVSNQGLPLGMGQRIWNNCGAPAIPSSVELQQQLETLSQGKETAVS